jgi:hypothetical protein
VAGGTASDDMPVTPGAYDTSFNTGGNQIGGHGPSDVYIAKYTPDGQLVWATYLGGPNYDRAYAIELDPAGDVVISGRAGPGFPTTPGVFQPEYKGNGGGFYGVQGGFIAKLSADGSSLLWSSNVGVGQLTRDFTLDAAGDIYMKTGTTPTSPLNNPPAWFAAGYANAYQPKPVDSDDAGLIKITNDGTAVVWATWLGGHGVDSQPGTLKVDADGNVYMAFYTRPRTSRPRRAPTTPATTAATTSSSPSSRRTARSCCSAPTSAAAATTSSRPAGSARRRRQHVRDVRHRLARSPDHAGGLPGRERRGP